jgi:uncharacterized membrane protein
MNQKIIFYVCLGAAACLGALGDGLGNLWIKKHVTNLAVVGGFLLINLAFALFLFVQKQGNHLFYSGTIFFVANAVLLYFISQAWFAERLSLQTWIGIGIIALGLIVAELGRA